MSTAYRRLRVHRFVMPHVELAMYGFMEREQSELDEMAASLQSWGLTCIRLFESVAMAWTYLKFRAEDYDCDAYVAEKNQELPPIGSAFLAFDTHRWKVVVGFRESIGCLSILNPNVCDDCNVVAFAPIRETDAIDLEKVKAIGPWWEGPINDCYAADGIALL